MIGNLYMHVSIGLTLKDACEIEEVHPSTVRKWEQKGRKAKSGMYFKLAQSMKKARANNKRHHMSKIYDANDWRASQWYLATVYNEEFGEKKNINVNGQLEFTNHINKQLLDKIIEEEQEYIDDEE